LKWWKERKINKQRKEAIQRNKEIDRMLRTSAKEDLGRKILLLGQSESGKSTFAKQMCFLHQPGWFSDGNWLPYRDVICRNTIVGMRGLINILEAPLSNPKNQEHMKMIMDVDVYDSEFLHQNAQALKSLWEDESIQAALQHTSKCSWYDLVSTIAESN